MWLHPYGNEGGGNFSGVCHGKDQAVSFNKLALIPKTNMQNRDFKMGKIKTPGCVITCQGNLDSKHSCQRGNPKNKNI